MATANGHMTPSKDSAIYPKLTVTVSGRTVNYKLEYWVHWGPINWSTNNSYKVTGSGCISGTQTKSGAIKSTSSSSGLTIQCFTGSFTATNAGGTATVSISNNTFNATYNNTTFTGMSVSCSTSVAAATTYTKVSTPTWKSGNGATFYGNLNGGNGNVNVSWNASSAGTNNNVTGYLIQAQYPGGTWYNKWEDTGTSATLNFDGVSGENCNIKLRIQAKGSAGSSYYSNWSSEISVTALGRTKCTAPTSVVCRSGTSTSSAAVSTINCGTTYYIHFSGAASGLNNSISSYALYCRNKTTNGSWYQWTTKSSTATSGYFSLSVTSSYDYEWSVQARGSAGSSYYSTYGTYIDTVSHKPTNPTSCVFSAPTSTTGPNLYSITHPVLGSAYLASYAEAPNGTLSVSIRFTGAIGAEYLRVSWGLHEFGQTPVEGTSSPTPSVNGWTSDKSDLSPGSTYNSTWNRRTAGRIAQYQVDAIGYNGSVSSGYYYSKPILFAGCLSTKQSSQWKIGKVSVKKSNAWKDAVQVWTKVSGVWKKSF